MKKAEKYRKMSKIIQYGGMALIILVGFILIYIFNFKDGKGDLSKSMTYIMGTIIALFIFMICVNVPMTNHLTKLIIEASVEGLVTDLKFSKKKGFTKETFESFNVATDKAEDYLCTDYYSFTYNNQTIESATINYSATKKLPKKNKPKKLAKINVKYFFGRVYVIPYTNESGIEVKVLGKAQQSLSKEKLMSTTNTPNILPIKIKKYSDNFEVYYGENKPTMDIQGLLERLYYLKMQAKGTISAIVRKKTIILFIDNNHYYAELEPKQKVDEDLIRGYRKDISMALTFIDSLTTLNKEKKKG